MQRRGVGCGEEVCGFNPGADAREARPYAGRAAGWGGAEIKGGVVSFLARMGRKRPVSVVSRASGRAWGQSKRMSEAVSRNVVGVRMLESGNGESESGGVAVRKPKGWAVVPSAEGCGG